MTTHMLPEFSAFDILADNEDYGHDSLGFDSELDGEHDELRRAFQDVLRDIDCSRV